MKHCHLALVFVVFTALAFAQPPQTDDPQSVEPLAHELHEECSVGVAAGRATADGRPLLWKNRDARHRNNVVRHFTDGRWPYVALCNAGATKNVWGGANAAGFCIMNSLSRDLAGKSKQGPGNGRFMKLALQRCETVEDFDQLLRATNETQRRTRANFGVIDAAGGAAIFETGHDNFVRFDASDSEEGILVRTNFATTSNGIGGKERFARASSICFERPEPHDFDHKFLLQKFCRDLTPPPSALAGVEGTQDVRETIHRQTTVAAMVFCGVSNGENPRTTTMWAILGQPLFSIAVPVWPSAGGVAHEIEGTPRSALCDASLQLETGFYVEPGSADEPEHDDVAGAIRWLRSSELPRVTRALRPVENHILTATLARMDGWRTQGAEPTPADMLAFHQTQVDKALAALRAAVQATQAPAATGKTGHAPRK